jgi:hypothetical protein
MIKDWNSFLNESNTKIIYHFTESFDSLYSILISDSLEAGSSHNRYGKGYDNISFTWNSKLWNIEYVGDTQPRYSVRISFDYNEISKKWDFKPFDYGIEEEQEEVVETDIMEVNNLRNKFPSLNIKQL